jgi:hypothetical protein
MQKGGFKKIVKTSAKMALDQKEKEYDEGAMRLDQQKMYILLQLAILFFEILIPIQMIGLAAYDAILDKH